jgi:HlyD family secretion protein
MTLSFRSFGQHYFLLIVGAAALVIGFVYVRMPVGIPDGLIQANGRIEGDTIAVAGKIAGKIASVEVREGDAVKEGQLLVRLEDAQLRARVDQSIAVVAALESQLASAKIGLDLLRNEVPLTVDAARAAVGQAQATIAKAEASEQQARRDAGRARNLAAKGTASIQQAERAQHALDVAASELTLAREALVHRRKQLALAELGVDRIRAKEAEFLALQAQLRQAKAALAEAESVLGDLTIRAPIAGVVLARVREPGEVVSVGAPLLELVDLDQLYLKVFVPGVEIGKLRLGLPAQIYTDAFPDRPFSATVRYIASRAEFTPKEVQTPDERVKLVYAVELYLDANPEHRLTPGLPADAMIRWKESTPWAKPRW